MPATKSTSTPVASQTLAAGGTFFSNPIDLTSKYGSTITAQITNGSTAPTNPAVVLVQFGLDTSNFYTAAVGAAGLASLQAYEFVFDVPASVSYVRLAFTGNTGQGVQIGAQMHTLESI